MAKLAKTQAAIQSINARGILLVFPIENRTDIPSLWSCFYPRSKMKWEWDENGDDRVAQLWRLREQLSLSNEVIYSKWFRGRATFFSKEVFAAILKLTNPEPHPEQVLSQDARNVLQALEMDSPLSTKQLKRAVDLQGRFNEVTYTRALKELWNRLLIVAYGEVDEGTFPSLALGATRVLFEELYRSARSMKSDKAEQIVNRLPEDSQFRIFFEKQRKKCAAA
jgi:hypothetical protein